LEPEVAREFRELMAADLPVPLKLLENELHINWNMIVRFFMIGREEDLHGVCTTQPHILAKGAQNREQHHQQGSKSFVSNVVDQNNIDNFFSYPVNRV